MSTADYETKSYGTCQLLPGARGVLRHFGHPPPGRRSPRRRGIRGVNCGASVGQCGLGLRRCMHTVFFTQPIAASRWGRHRSRGVWRPARASYL